MMVLKRSGLLFYAPDPLFSGKDALNIMQKAYAKKIVWAVPLFYDIKKFKRLLLINRIINQDTK
jgi:hypothetical protein